MLLVSWDDYSQFFLERHKSHVPNHQPAIQFSAFSDKPIWMERMPRSWAFDSVKRQPSDRGPPQWAPNSCLPGSSMDYCIIFSSLKWHIGEGNPLLLNKSQHDMTSICINFLVTFPSVYSLWLVIYFIMFFANLFWQVDHLSSMAKKELVWEPQQALLTMFAKRKPCGSSGIIDSFPQILTVLQQPMLAAF